MFNFIVTFGRRICHICCYIFFVYSGSVLILVLVALLSVLLGLWLFLDLALVPFLALLVVY